MKIDAFNNNIDNANSSEGGKIDQFLLVYLILIQYLIIFPL